MEGVPPLPPLQALTAKKTGPDPYLSNTAGRSTDLPDEIMAKIRGRET